MRRVVVRAPLAAVVLAFLSGVAVVAHAQARASTPPALAPTPLPAASGGAVLTSTSEPFGPEAAAFSLLRSAVQSSVGGVADRLLPDWARRVEADLDFGVGKPDYGLFTVQPLYQSEDLVHTLFTQVRLDWVETDRL